ncbi:hypothetical protein KAR91_44630 [Candidatus Pacearchaeota archaeon]|nr:hypothetical protein [Candidatus Pacearchaeota archaeon]
MKSETKKADELLWTGLTKEEFEKMMEFPERLMRVSREAENRRWKILLKDRIEELDKEVKRIYKVRTKDEIAHLSKADKAEIRRCLNIKTELQDLLEDGDEDGKTKKTSKM